jgi:16S rRNA (cytidine1402-2'-O)-methyltransferase
MLYVVSTPLGNLDDLSIRQAKTIMNSELVLAEDTRSAQTLVEGIRSRFDSLPAENPKIVSYYKEREFEKLPWIIEQLKDGKEISLISENGTPLVSDPGYLLVKTAIKENIPMTVIPGASAVITALIYSGFNPNPKEGGFSFMGFFPRKPNEGRQMIDRLMKSKEIFPDSVFVFYESPQRIRATLETISNSDWNPDIAVCREMTKKFEEITRGKAAQLMTREYKGEITIVIK